jgi:hypothetical protein
MSLLSYLFGDYRLGNSSLTNDFEKITVPLAKAGAIFGKAIISYQTKGPGVSS